MAIREILEDFVARAHLNKLLKSERTNEKIRVCFLVQMSEIWDKQASVYEAMKQKDNFDVKMIVIPAYDLIAQRIKDEYDDCFFLNKYADAIKALKDGRWIKLKDYKFDYVFYQRPYNYYLPDCYKSFVVGKYSKCCYIPYAFWPFEDELCGYNKDFFRYIYISFIESREHIGLLKKKYGASNRMEFCGYPQLSTIDFVKNYDLERILWTPRWSYDSTVGGSHFFEYKEKIFELSDDYGINEIIIRPHPMAFENYIRTGMMTEGEVDEYRKKVDNHPRVRFDLNMSIEDTFKTIGVLITDVSSIVFPFFLTGKPIIYCGSNMQLSPVFKYLMSGMYVADDWNDIRVYIRQILSGKDVLQSVRYELANRMKQEHINAVERIIKTIENDACN